MRTASKLVALAASLTVAALASTAGATNTTLWVHGRTSGSPAVPVNFGYWMDGEGGNIAQGVGVNATAVNYDGTAHISTSNPTVVAALNTYCTGANSCYVAAHSAGAAQIGYAEALYPGLWNILWVATGGSAAGGSELAGNVAYFFDGENIDLDLAVGTMRGMYNHDVMGDDIVGDVYNHLGGDYASLTTCLFPGGCAFGDGSNDSAVAFHSSGHYRAVTTTEKDKAAGARSDTGTWWSHSYAQFVDSSDGNYGHCVSGSYPCEEGNAGGIMGKVASFISANAH